MSAADHLKTIRERIEAMDSGEADWSEAASHLTTYDLPRLLDAVEKVIAVHEMSPGTRWVGFPRADREEHYCIHDNKSWPCDTVQAITTALEGK